MKPETAKRDTKPEPRSETPEPAPARNYTWSDDFDAAPKDGSPLLLTPDGEEQVEAVWRPTRAYNGKTNRWEIAGYWADRWMKVRLPFEPLGWAAIAPAPQEKAPIAPPRL